VDWIDAYVAAFNSYDVEALVPFFAAACQYTDMPHAMIWQGHEGIREMYAATLAFHSDGILHKTGGFHDGSHYYIEWVTDGTVAGERVSYAGVSVGTLDDQGRIASTRDYWNPKDVPILDNWRPTP
jgi:hypothetical protein